MRVGIILANFERPGKARQRLVMAIERLQREAAIIPSFHVVGSDRERAVISRHRLLIAARAEQAYATVVVRRRIAREQPQGSVQLPQPLPIPFSTAPPHTPLHSR